MLKILRNLIYLNNKELTELAKREIVGKKLLYFNRLIPITKIQYISNDMILAYSENNWCCNLELLKTKDGRFVANVLREGEKFLT
jgi:hypothetical protein